jgi:hypothetical protein
MTDSVTIDGHTFYASPTANGWTYTRLQGWYGSPPMRANVMDRPNQDGAFGVVRNYRSARSITFDGHLYADTAGEAVTDLWNVFSAIQGSGAPFTFSVADDFTTPLSCEVTLSGSVEVEPISPEAARVTATFVAYDPVKYGPDVEYSTGLASGGGGLEYELGEGGAGGALYYGALGNLGRVTLTNAGTADVWPVFVVSGALTDGFYLQRLDTGDVLRYDRVVPAGSTVSIDSRTGAVLVDGVSDASTYLTRDQFFSVPAGGSIDVQFNAISTSSGTPTMTATVPSGGWW